MNDLMSPVPRIAMALIVLVLATAPAFSSAEAPRCDELTAMFAWWNSAIRRRPAVQDLGVDSAPVFAAIELVP